MVQTDGMSIAKCNHLDPPHTKKKRKEKGGDGEK